MQDWKGCRVLEPAVALLVQNAIPLYLIGTGSNDAERFSGSRVVMQSTDCGGTLPTYYETLMVGLGEFVRNARAQQRCLSQMTTNEGRGECFCMAMMSH